MEITCAAHRPSSRNVESIILYNILLTLRGNHRSASNVKKKHLNVKNSWCTSCSSILNQNSLNLLLGGIPPLFCTASDDLQQQLHNLIGFNLGSCNSQLPDPSRLLRPPDGQLQVSNFEQQLCSLNFEEQFDSLTSHMNFEKLSSLNFKQKLGSSAISNSGWIAPDRQHQAYEQRLAPGRQLPLQNLKFAGWHQYSDCSRSDFSLDSRCSCSDPQGFRKSLGVREWSRSLRAGEKSINTDCLEEVLRTLYLSSPTFGRCLGTLSRHNSRSSDFY